MRGLARRFLFVSGLFTVVLAIASCSHRRITNLAITHVTVIDGSGGAPLLDCTVIISGPRIASVGRATATAIPDETQVVDGSGKFLIPGLADMHVHLTGAGEPSGSRRFILPLLVANGITTVRDMGGNIEFLKALREEINSGKRAGPQIVFTGPYLDGNPPSFQPSMVVENAAEAALAVDKLQGGGGRLHKSAIAVATRGVFRDSDRIEESGYSLRRTCAGLDYGGRGFGCGAGQY